MAGLSSDEVLHQACFPARRSPHGDGSSRAHRFVTSPINVDDVIEREPDSIIRSDSWGARFVPQGACQLGCRVCCEQQEAAGEELPRGDHRRTPGLAQAVGSIHRSHTHEPACRGTVKVVAVVAGVVVGVVVVVAVALGAWLQPRTTNEAACYWMQRQLDGDTSTLDKIACKREASSLTAQRQADAEQRRQDDAVRARQEAELERQETERRAQVEAQRREEEACLVAAEREYAEEAEDLEERWQDLNFIPPDISDSEYEALMRDFESVDAKLDEVLAEWDAAKEACRQ